MVSPILTPPVSLIQAARVCIERTLDVPQAAAGPLVTPTKPILSSLLAACAAIVLAAIANAEAAPSAMDISTERLLIIVLPLLVIAPFFLTGYVDALRETKAPRIVNIIIRFCIQSLFALETDVMRPD